MIMNIQAVAKNVRVSPRKVRLVADAIRNLGVIDAMNLLQAQEQQAAKSLAKTLKSAVANAVNNAKLDSTNLFISTIMINQGQSFKRFRPSTRGRIHPYKKRGSNITIIVTEKIISKPAIKVEESKVEKKSADAKAVADKGGKK
jgi:large subunit ribosomal protein L22